MAFIVDQSKIEFKHDPNGRELSCWKGNAYETNDDVEKFLKGTGTGWKIHLNVPVDKNHPTTKGIADYLNTSPLVRQYKIGIGGEECDGKGMTIYCGSWDRVTEVAKAIHEKFGSQLGEAKAVDTDMRLIGNVAARFDAQKFHAEKTPPGQMATQEYQPYGPTNGIAPLGHHFTADTYTFWKQPADQTPDVRQRIGKRAINKYVDDFGDYLLGEGNTKKYIESGRNIDALPEWTQKWVKDGRVPETLQTALSPGTHILPQWLANNLAAQNQSKAQHNFPNTASPAPANIDPKTKEVLDVIRKQEIFKKWGSICQEKADGKPFDTKQFATLRQSLVDMGCKFPTADSEPGTYQASANAVTHSPNKIPGRP